MNFDIPIQDDIMYLLQEIGHNCRVNNIPAKAIVNNTNNEYDDKRIITNEEIQRGDYIEYNGLYFLVVDDAVDKRYKTYYKSKMRKCNFDIKFIIDNKLYIFPSIIDGDKFFMQDNDIMPLNADTITVTLPATNITKQIKKQDCFIKWGQKWEIQGINNTKSGFVILNCKMTIINSTNDDMENEIADRWINGIDRLSEVPENPPPIQNSLTYSIIGADEIIWNDTQTYTVKKYIDDVEVSGNFTFEIIGDYAIISNFTNNTVDILAMEYDYGEITLIATDVDTGETVNKSIVIVGLI